MKIFKMSYFSLTFDFNEKKKAHLKEFNLEGRLQVNFC